MDDAARARAAAREAIDDIAPEPLREVIDARLRDATMTPGVLTRLAARATERDADPEELDRRAAGVQLIYDGLDLTRTLARAPPWAGAEDTTPADIDVLAADVLVARGFFLLARTEAAPKAVATVRAFGRDETDRAEGRPVEPADCALEADVFELAIVAGISATGADPPEETRAFAVDLAGSIDRTLPSAPELLSDPAVEALADLVDEPGRSTASPDRIWATSSASDP